MSREIAVVVVCQGLIEKGRLVNSRVVGGRRDCLGQFCSGKQRPVLYLPQKH
jgi:hypothetical protein